MIVVSTWHASRLIQRCQRTEMPQAQGDDRGMVGDIFLPDWIAGRIYLISTALLSLWLGSLLLRWIFRSTRHPS